ncbi:serine/threonine-protein kinase [Mangrovihabitans endophyticus]|uniref:non-specific serine/threonine protein kinase n=1 Tax=Mangrovihabitans endophyticus TaxID=1751298 RepID=A0A8J3BUE4_9ACTN|nr:serine/threonine-protein kinase [Mangrovihabitans endophyticus]GGK78832.1 hypothetical protein GCM10012284_10940 [Mangrovihabitans endophyticus]
MDTAYRVSPLFDSDPECLGGYDVAGRLGSGGMGVVYLGRNPEGAYVAIKTVQARLLERSEFRKRFRGEIERVRQVPPYCTAELLDADLDHEPPYLVIEYVDGPSLAEVVEQRGPLRGAQLHPLAAGVATALVGIHGAGVVHRDLKPENVLLPPGNPKVVDFGIARTLDAATGYTSAERTIGTIAYMAPERIDVASQTPIGSAADVFAWGCIVAYAATGRSPFAGDSISATAARILTQPPDLDGLAPPLRGAVEAALAKEPERRPTARELLDMLVDAVEGASGPQQVARVPARRARRHRRAMIAAAAGVLLTGTAATAFAVDRGHEPPPAAPGPNASAQASPAPSTQVLIHDALKAPSAWPDTETSAHNARCTVTDVLTVERTERKSYKCPGAETPVSDDFSARFNVTLASLGSCASLWFYWNPARGGDVLRVCRNSIAVEVDDGDDKTVVGSLPAARRILVGWTARIRIDVADGTVTIYRGGGVAGRVRLPAGSPSTGKLRLGIDVEPHAGQAPFTVTFSGLDVRTI